MKHSLNEQLMARKAAATPRGVGVMGSFFVDKALNSELWDIEGRRFIDFAGGIAVMNTGHRHPKVVQAMQAQLERFTHTCYQVVPYESYIALAEKLNALTPGTHAKKTALFSTGAEAVENAIKIARAATKRSGVIAFSGAFHGRSMFAVAMTGKVQPYKADFGPFPPEIFHAPFPCHCANLDEVKKAIHHIFKSDIEPARVAAIIFEPVQGEGGFNVIQREAVKWLRQLCDTHGILLIADEVQTGFGRTGTNFWGFQNYEVVPDIVVMAKSIGNGFPLAAVVTTDAIAEKMLGKIHFNTFGGDPLAMAQGKATLDIMLRDHTMAHCKKIGDQLIAGLGKLKTKYPVIANVRGSGLILGVEFVLDGQPATAFTASFMERCKDHQLIVGKGGLHGSVIRIKPPMCVTEADAEFLLAVFDHVLAELTA